MGITPAADECAASGAIARPTVYLDTTIPSYLTGRPAREQVLRRCQWVTCLFWNGYRSRFEFHVSQLVRDEAAVGDPNYARRRIEMLSPLHKLDMPEDIERLGGLILKRTGLPKSAKADAEHVAIAATHRIEFLVTWNCKHLANPAIAPKVARACERAGFRSPEICTPEIILRRVVYGTLPSHRITREQSRRARPI